MSLLTLIIIFLVVAAIFVFAGPNMDRQDNKDNHNHHTEEIFSYVWYQGYHIGVEEECRAIKMTMDRGEKVPVKILMFYEDSCFEDNCIEEN